MFHLARRRFLAALAVSMAGLGLRRAAALPVPAEPDHAPPRVCHDCRRRGRRMIVLSHNGRYHPPACLACGGVISRNRLGV